MDPKPGMAEAQVAEQQQPQTTPEVKSDAEDYKAKYSGLQGNFKQIKDERDALMRELAESRAFKEQLEEARKEAEEESQEERSISQARSLLELPPDELVDRLKNKVVEDEAAIRSRRQLKRQSREEMPKVVKQATDSVHQFYIGGVRKYAEQMGVPEAEARKMFEESQGKYDEFLVKIGRAAVTREVERTAKVENQTLVDSITQTVLATIRGDKPSPDTGQSREPVVANSFGELESQWLDGKVSDEDYRAARKKKGLR